MTARTHPEKKWVAGTNESKARANHWVGKSRLTEWIHRRHAGDASQRGEKGQCIGELNLWFCSDTSPCPWWKLRLLFLCSWLHHLLAIELSRIATE